MIEAENKYCRQCDCEYMPHIIDCPVCATALVTGQQLLDEQEAKMAELARRPSTLTPEDDLVKIRNGALADMRIFAELLQEANIASLISGDEQSCGKGCCAPSLDLLVRRQDAPEAVQIIEAEIRRTSVFDEEHDPELANAVFDPEAEESMCPACGHRFSGTNECPDCGLCF